MTRFLFIVVSFLSIAFEASAQVDRQDSLVHIVPYFCSRDTMTYNAIGREYRIAHDDTLLVQSLEQRFQICVTDSTPRGYTIEYTLLEVMPDTTLTDFKNQMKAGFATALTGLTVRLDIDEWGEIKRIDNWKDIRKRILDNQDELLERWYGQFPALNGLVPRKNLEKLIRTAFDNEKNILSATEHLEQIFACYNRSLPLDKEIVDEDPGGKDSYPSSTYLIATADPQDDYTFYMETEQTIPEEDLKALTGAAMGLVTEGATREKLDEALQDQSFGNARIVDILSNEYFYDGWPKLLISQRTVRFETLEQSQITQNIIEWETRSVGNP